MATRDLRFGHITTLPSLAQFLLPRVPAEHPATEGRERGTPQRDMSLEVIESENWLG